MKKYKPMSDYSQCCTTVAMQCYTICCVDYFIHAIRKREVTTFLFLLKINKPSNKMK